MQTSAPTVILCAPQGTGKTTAARTIAAALGCTQIIEEWNGSDPLPDGALALTNATLLIAVAPSKAVVIKADSAGALDRIVKELGPPAAAAERICADCRYFGKVAPQPECLHPSVASPADVVTGEQDGPECRDARAIDGMCRPAGRLFEPSEEKQRAQACTNKVRARHPYALSPELMPACVAASIRSRSDSISGNNASACAGCAFSPNSL